MGLKYYVGLDLGQLRDYTALAVLEVRLPDKPDPTIYFNHATGDVIRPHEERSAPATYAVRRLERVRGRPYPEIVALVGDLMRDPAYPGARLLVDATGVGVAVTDMLRAAGLGFASVTITGGDRASREGDLWRVPKRDLVSAVDVLLQSDRLQLAAGMPLVDILTRELREFKVKINLETAHDSYGAWREGQHDDLVLAVALAAWMAERNHGPRREKLEVF